jgi:hypothetical protein
MKTLQILASCLLIFTFSCKDDSDNSPAVANDEAANMIATSMASGSGGLTTMIDDTSVSTSANAAGRIEACGYSDSEDVTKTNPSGAPVTYDYNFHYDYSVTCTNAIPTTFLANVSYSGSIDALKLSTENAGKANLTVKTLNATYTYFTFNGSFDRTGSFASKVRNKNTSTSTVTINLTDVTVDKTSRMITGGTASIDITGTVTGKGTFSYSGTITFKGNKQAELNINGTKYSVDLETGDVTAL